jgi:ribonuclease T2
MIRPGSFSGVRAALSVLAAALMVVFASPAAAQLFSRPSRAQPPCVLDKCLDGTGHDAAPSDPGAPPPVSPSPTPASPMSAAAGGPLAPGSFDFYVLSLSWSPGFCDTGGAAKAGDQCAEGAGLGFVVHGLWPQNTRGFPSDCDAGTVFPSRAALDLTRGVYPDVGLARYEWRKHGTCTGLSPTDYFRAVKRARDAVTIPQTLQQPREPQTLAPLDIARAFAASNQGLRSDTMAVTCREGELQEVRLCFTKDLRGFISCPEVARGACRTRSISVLPVQ